MTAPAPKPGPEADAAPPRVALVFIHGIGIQDRYQQLTAFTRGLGETPTGEFEVLPRGAEDAPQGNFVPLNVRPMAAGPAQNAARL